MASCARAVINVLLAMSALSNLTFAQTATPVSADKFRDLTMPFDDRLVNYFFGAAKPPTGETVELRAKGPILLHIGRFNRLPTGARVTLRVKTLNGLELARWVTEMDPERWYIRQIDIPDNVHSLEITIVDWAEGGPTERHPFTLILEAWPLSGNSILELPMQNDSRESTDPQFLTSLPPTCKMVSVSSKRVDYIERFSEATLSGLPVGVPVQKIFSAGGYLLISPPIGMAADNKLTIRLSVKHSGDGPYVDVCPATEFPGGSIESLEAALPTHGSNSLWRVELTIAKPLPAAEKTKIWLTRERTFSLLPEEPGWNDVFGLTCFDRRTNFVGVSQTANPFGGRTKLKVLVPAVGSVPIGIDERAAAELAILQAASLWVYSCIACRNDNLAVISINDKTYVSSNLYTAVGPPRGAEASPFEPLDREKLLKDFLGNSRIGVGTWNLQYFYVENPNKEFAQLCSASTSDQTPTLKRVQEAICTDTIRPENTANIRINFKRRETTCGNDPNIVGCRADHELTQYNVRDYRFVSQRSGVSIGSGPIEIDLLQAVLHEMGHWIGIDHLTGGESIMASSIEQARCIDFETVKVLAEQVYGSNGPPKAVSPQALTLRKKPSK